MTPEAPAIPVALQLDERSFPHAVSRLQVCETAISWVVLTGPYAYKIKKPVQLPFIDASTLEQREFLCREELRLNRRFAPDLYLDVAPIIEHEGNYCIGQDGAPVEYAVRMRQFERSQELAQQLAHDRVTAAEIADLGQRLARWHETASAAPAATQYGTLELIGDQVQENFDTLRTSLPVAELVRLSRLEQWTGSELERLAGTLEQRRRAHRVRECHGDLHAGNIVRWRTSLLPFDCLEFDPRLRWIDVISDAAFLFMDLLARGRPDLAHAFLSACLEHSGDYAALRLLRFYGVYRALVRAKVAALSSGQLPVIGQAEASGEVTASQRLTLAERLMTHTRPAVLLMHGVTASGKSYLSSRLIGAAGAVRIRSDLERRRLFGPGVYSASATRATYQRLRLCAAIALESGYRALVDAAFLEPQQRAGFEELAREYRCPLVIVSCRAPRSVLVGRIEARARAAQDPSEATLAVLDAQLERLSALQEQERPNVIEVDTTSAAAIEDVIEAVRKRLGTAPV